MNFERYVSLFGLILAGCGNTAEPVETRGPSIDVDELTSEHFLGEWCLVSSTKNGPVETPNINFRFTSAKTLAFERSSGSGKFGAGSWSWSSEANVFLLRTPPTLMKTASIDSATDSSFVVGGKIGYTFERGVCGTE